MDAARRLRVLVTGGAGAVGRVVCRALAARGHAVRSFDRTTAPTASDSHVGDLTDPAALDRAMTDVEVVVHLAAYPNDGDFMTQILPSNIVGTWQLMEAARRAGVVRLVLTSSMQTLNALPRPKDRPVAVADGTWPTNTYGVSKVFLEEMAKMYAAEFRMAPVAVRIGWFLRNEKEAANMRGGGRSIYLSHLDAGRFYCAAVESERPRPGEYVILFATSRPVGGLGPDLATAKEWIGYEPAQAWPEGLEDIPGVSPEVLAQLLAMPHDGAHRR